MGVDAGTHLIAELTLKQMRHAAGELDHFEATDDFTVGIADGLAVLPGNGACQCVAVFFEQFLELEHDARALQVRCG